MDLAKFSLSNLPPYTRRTVAITAAFLGIGGIGAYNNTQTPEQPAAPSVATTTSTTEQAEAITGALTGTQVKSALENLEVTETVTDNVEVAADPEVVVDAAKVAANTDVATEAVEAALETGAGADVVDDATETEVIAEGTKETQLVSAANEAAGETETVAQVVEAVTEAEVVTDPGNTAVAEVAETAVEAEVVAEAVEAPVETEVVADAVEAAVETEVVAEAVEAAVETEVVAEAVEAAVETEVVAEATDIVATATPTSEVAEVIGAVAAAAALDDDSAPSATVTQPPVTETKQTEVTIPQSTPTVGATAIPDDTTPRAVTELVGNYPGKLLMVVFWSTASEAEAQSFGWINEMHQRYANRGLHIVGVNQDSTARKGEAYAVKQGAKFEITHDRSGALRKALWVGQLPATYLLNDAGELLGSHAGFNDDIRGSYEDEIRRLLKTLR